MKKITVIFLFFMVFLIFGSRAWAISWENDLAQAFEKAKNEGKPVMADFYTDWCSWCKKLDKDVYEDANVNQLAEKFICVKVNCEIDKSAFSKYGLKGYPTTIFFNDQGGIEETISGYEKADVFTCAMKKVLDIKKVIDKMSGAMTDRKRPADKSVIQKTVTDRQQLTNEIVIKKTRGEGEFELAGIMGSKAIVNDKVVKVGDEVDNAKVIEITQSYIKLWHKDKELMLRMDSK